MGSRWFAAASIVLLTAPAAVRAQLDVRLEPLEATREERQPRVGVLPLHPGPTVGGYGCVRCWVRNPDLEAHEVLIELVGLKGGEDVARVREVVSLQAGTESVVHVPYPCIGHGVRLQMSVDSTLRFDQSVIRSAVTTLCVSSAPNFPARHEALRTAAGATHAVKIGLGRPVTCTPEELPDEWAWLTGFDLVIVDGTSSEFDARAQSVVTKLVCGGADVVVAGAERLAPGPLASLCRAMAGGGGYVGLGRLAVVKGPLPKLPDSAVASAVVSVFAPPAGLALPSWPGASVTLASGPIPEEFFEVREVPGVRGLPTNVFFVVVLLFVITVGPLNHVLLWRRGRPWLVLITVPLGGFAVAGIILTWALIEEGTQSIGVVRSVSMLDQREHTVLGLDSRTVFAGVSPDAMEYPSGAFLAGGDFYFERERRARFDLGNGVIDGAWLPSRRPTNFVTIDQRPCRERLRVDLSAQRVEFTDGLRPVDDGESVLVCDPDGRFWGVRADGSMREVQASNADSIVRARLRALVPANQSLGLVQWLAPRIGTSLEPGTYFGRFVRAPALDDHGAPFDERASIHLVRGVLDAKDVRR